jgi:hypothetical protein
MKTQKRFFGLLLFLHATLAFADQFAASLEQYASDVNAALAAERQPVAKVYLQGRLGDVALLRGFAVTHPGLTEAFNQVVARRIAADGLLTAETTTANVQRETKSYNDHLEPYRAQQFRDLIALQDQLLQRKYFKTKTAKNANYIEGWVNSHWSLTRIDHSETMKVLAMPTFGVSPWEAIFRFEPTAAMRGGPQAAIMGTAGLSHAYFPSVDRSSVPPAFQESFASEWLKKSGLRVGAGAGRFDGKTRFLLGPGIQVNALGVWGLYDPKDKSWMLGLSTADLSKLKKMLGWFD